MILKMLLLVLAMMAIEIRAELSYACWDPDKNPNTKERKTKEYYESCHGPTECKCQANEVLCFTQNSEGVDELLV